MSDVLLVADEPWIRNQVRAALSDPDDVLREVRDPRAVTAAIAEFDPDVVVVDLQVGNMGGMAIARAIRESFLAGEIERVAMVMILDRRLDAFLARRAGVTSWLTKPFTPFELRRCVEEAHRTLTSA